LRAAAEGISGVNAAWHTAPTASCRLGLTALCDNKGAQIVYAPSPVVRQTVLDARPEIPALLARSLPTSI